MIELQQDYFERSAAKYPERVAVDDNGKTTTYKVLEQNANRLAHLLVSGGCAPNDRVCILTEKNVDMYTAVLGTLKSGACWTPLSTAFPNDRMTSIVQSLKPKAIIASPSTLESARSAQKNSALKFPIVVLGDGGDQQLAKMPTTPPSRLRFSPDDLAYIIFTSGSTGTAKGVMVLQRNTTQFLSLCPEFFQIEDGARFAHFSELTFDPSVFDMFHCWSTGGTLVPFNKRSYRINPGAFIAEQKINVLFTVPSVLASIRDAGTLRTLDLSPLKHLLLTGEAASAEVLAEWSQAYPKTHLYNLFGTTETAIISHWYRFAKPIVKNAPIPVGHPLPGTRVMILNGDMPVGLGETGESVVYGSQLSPGYWDNEFHTQMAFVPNPIAPGLPQRVYRTGDLLREGENGIHYFAGRADKQVKVRGHRVELGEVESVMMSHPQVRDAIVLAVGEDGRYDKRLVAFVVTAEAVTTEALSRHLEDELPNYMVPSRILKMDDDFPRNQNGKIDLVALNKMASVTLQESKGSA